MPLKLEVAALTEVPNEMQSLYKESSGKFVLDVDGLEDVLGAKNKVAEFRQTNIDLMKKLENAQKSGAGLSEIEKQELARLKQVEKEFKSSQRVSMSEMDNLVAARTKQLQEELSARIADEEKEKTQYRSMFEAEKVGNVLRNEAVRAGVLPEALDDVMARASSVFKLHDNEITAFSKDEVLYGTDGKRLTVGEWLDKLSLSAKHLFMPNRGSGAQGSSSTNSRVNVDAMSSTQRIELGLKQKLAGR
jgi:hypothetical protein